MLPPTSRCRAAATAAASEVRLWQEVVNNPLACQDAFRDERQWQRRYHGGATRATATATAADAGPSPRLHIVIEVDEKCYGVNNMNH